MGSVLSSKRGLYSTCASLVVPHPSTGQVHGAESDSSNTTLRDNCSKTLQKPLVCARCKTSTYCSKDCQVNTAHRKRVGLAIKAIIDYSNAHTNTNVTE